MATRPGKIKKTSLADYAKIRANGLIAINLVDGDELQWVGLSDGESDIIVATRKGQAARFREAEVRPLGRGTQGVTAVRLGRATRSSAWRLSRTAQDELLVVTEQGFGKRTEVEDFPIKHRATGGVIANSLNKDTGDVAAVRLVGREDEQLMLITESGTILRTEVGGINRYRRVPRRDRDEARGRRSDRLDDGLRRRPAARGSPRSGVGEWMGCPGTHPGYAGGRLDQPQPMTFPI